MIFTIHFGGKPTIFGNTHLARLEYTEGDEDLDDDDDEKEKEDEAKKWWDVVVNILGVPRIWYLNRQICKR